MPGKTLLSEDGELYRQALSISNSDINVLILGETGSGKEVIANLIQENSRRTNKPYVKINCAAIPETLIESELFGHEKGAFTGALERKKGKLELANTGTILLDEIGDMRLELQARLLRVTDGKSFNRVGGNEEIPLDVRFISATHVNVENAIANGKFRSDLYYRLGVAIIIVPPLRQRRDEIQSVAEHILNRIRSEEIYGDAKSFSDDAIEAMLNYKWPGNFRELENRICMGLINSKTGEMKAADMFGLKEEDEIRLQQASIGSGDWVTGLMDLGLENIEKKLVMEALRRSNFVQKEAAKLLEISARALNYRIKYFGITHPTWPVHA